jgi:hypothetical protein
MAIYTYKNDIIVIDAMEETVLKTYTNLGSKVTNPEKPGDSFTPIYATINYPASSLCLVSDSGKVVQRDIKRKTNSSHIKLIKMRVVALEYVPFSEFENYVIIGSENSIITVLHFLFDNVRLV